MPINRLEDLIGMTFTIRLPVKVVAESGKVIDGTSRRVEEGKKMVAHQKPSSDLEEKSVISKGKMK